MNWQIPRRVELEHKMTRVSIREYPEYMYFEVYSGRRTYPAILKALPLHVIVLVREEEIPDSPFLGIKAKSFPILDRYPIRIGDGFRDMIVIETEEPC